MAYPLLATKLFIPPLRPNRVSRPRLLDKLTEGMRSGCRLALVSAPPGFGKTTLASEWAQQTGQPLAWLSLDAGDNDPIRLWNYLVAALQTVDPKLGVEMAAALQAPSPPPLESLITLLINDLATFGRSLILALDDYHHLEAKAAHETIDFFIEHLPPGVTLLLLTRSDPPLHLARRRGRGELCELRAIDLRFTNEEIGHFLTQTMHLSLPPADIRLLEESTEGWVAGLQMAAIAAHGRSDMHDFVSTISGDDRYIADYLVEEVLQRQTEETRRFLLQTSILERMSPASCNALTGRTDSQALLASLESANLFILPLDNRREWFRYHHLFAQLLRQHLKQILTPSEIHDLYAKASEWHRQSGALAEAVDYALAGSDYEEAARLIQEVLQPMMLRSELVTLQRWAELLPDKNLKEHPGLCVGLAWAANATSHDDTCERLIRIVEEHIQLTVDQFLSMEEIDRRNLPAETLGTVVELAVQRTRLALDAGALQLVLTRYITVLPYLTADRDSPPYVFNLPSDLRPPMVFMVAKAHEMTGDLAKAEAGYEEAARTGQEKHNIHIIAQGLGHLGQIQVVRGDLNRAEESFRQALNAARTWGGQASAFFGISHIGLGSVAYERGDLEEARRHFDEGLSLARLWNNWETLMPGYLGLAQLCFAEGDRVGAIQALEDLRAQGRSSPVIVNPFVDAWQAYFSIRQGKIEKAAQWANQCGYDLEARVQPALPDHGYVLAHLLFATNRIKAARRSLDQQVAAAAALGQWGHWIKLAALQALVLDRDGARQEALDQLAAALEKGQPQGYLRSFIDLGSPVAELFAALKGRSPAGQEFPLNEYTGRLLAAYRPGSLPEAAPASPGGKPAALLEPLSRREIEVLRLLAGGASNVEIATAAFISLNTVKKHITSIYGKLGVSTRLQAVERARQLKLLGEEDSTQATG